MIDYMSLFASFLSGEKKLHFFPTEKQKTDTYGIVFLFHLFTLKPVKRS